MHKLFSWGVGLILIFAAAPSSSNYTLRSYDIGTGGNSSSTSSNYKLNGVSGSQSADLQSSTTYGTVSGVNATEGSNVPAAPTFSNPSSYYNKLKLVLNTGGNPTDTKYLIAISSDSFTTTNYVQADDTVGSSQALTNYQTYATWGGASGFLILGLTPSTTYQVKVKALQGDFSGSSFGPPASASTIAPTLTMSLTTTATSTPPFAVDFTSLTPGSVVNGSADALVAFTSNAEGGGSVYTKSANAGLSSTLAGTTIASATTDLTSANTGYGAQVTSTSQSSGGPLTSQSPFNNTGNNVGGLSTALQALLTTSSPITGASGTIRLMAKAANTTPAANDYADIVTFVMTMTF